MQQKRTHLLLLGLLRLDDVLHNLRLLNEEGADNAGVSQIPAHHIPSADALRTAATTVSALHCLLALRKRGVRARANRLDARKRSVAVTTLRRSRQLLQVKVAQLAVRRLNNAPAVRPRVVGVTLAQSKTLSHLYCQYVYPMHTAQEHREHMWNKHPYAIAIEGDILCPSALTRLYTPLVYRGSVVGTSGDALALRRGPTF